MVRIAKIYGNGASTSNGCLIDSNERGSPWLTTVDHKTMEFS